MPPLHRFRPRLVDALDGYDRRRFARDVGAGVTVGVVALPLAMAFAIGSGVAPEAGIVSAIVAGFLISALGGSPVQIGGPAGAFVVIVYGIVERYGLANLLVATLLAGVLLFVLGLFRLGTLVRYIPVPIVIGFTNGIAVLIALSQVKDLLGLSIARLPADFFTQVGTIAAHLGTLRPAAVAVGLATLLIVAAWPRVTPRVVPTATAPAGPPGRAARLRTVVGRVPGTLVALAAVTAATAALGLPVETIGTRYGGIPQALPTFALPAFSWATVQFLLFPTLTIALLGAIESLLCARIADNVSGQPRHDPNQELMAQGIANVVTPLFGGIPATGTIARTMTNVRAGATSPVSGMVHAATLAAIVLVAAPLAAHVPLAALAGILLWVAWAMGEWREFARLRRFAVTYRTILLGTFVLTVVFDLTVAVQVGLLLACVFFVWRMARMFRIDELAADDLPPGVQAYAVRGALFFGAVGAVEELPQRVGAGTRTVVLGMERLISIDASGLEALRQLHRTLQRRGATLVLAAVDEQPLALIRRSGFDAEIGAANLVDDLDAVRRAAAPPDAAGGAGA